MNQFFHQLINVLLYTSILPEVRLVGSGYTDRGTIEVFHAGQWGSICDDSFDKNDGDVICRMLGFNSSRYLKQIVLAQLSRSFMWAFPIEIFGYPSLSITSHILVFFSRTIESISFKLGTKHPWRKRRASPFSLISKERSVDSQHILFSCVQKFAIVFRYLGKNFLGADPLTPNRGRLEKKLKMVSCSDQQLLFNNAFQNVCHFRDIRGQRFVVLVPQIPHYVTQT